MISLEQKIEAVLWLFATADESEFSKEWCESHDITTALAISHNLGYITTLTESGTQLLDQSLDLAVAGLGLDNLYGLIELIENSKQDTY